MPCALDSHPSHCIFYLANERKQSLQRNKKENLQPTKGKKLAEIDLCNWHHIKRVRLSALSLGASGHHVTGLLALVADTVLLAGALAGQVTDLSAVVALLTLGAVARQVSVTTARVTSLLTTSTEATLGLATAEAAGAAVSGALTGNVSDLSALVALGTSRRLVAAAHAGAAALHAAGLGAVTRKVTDLIAPVAGLLLLRTSALTAHVSVLSAVVAHGSTTLGAFTSLVSSLAAVVTSATTGSSTTIRGRSVGIHCVGCCFTVGSYERARKGAEGENRAKAKRNNGGGKVG